MYSRKRVARLLIGVATVYAGLAHALSLFDRITVDVGAFFVVAEGLTRGIPPYVGFVDHKPPGVYLLLAPVIKLGGGFVASNLLAFVANLLAAAGVYALTCRRFSQLAGSVSAVCYLVAAVVYAGTEPFTETFLAAALVGSLLAYDHHLDTGGQLSLALAGGAVGVATLFKQPAVGVGAAGVAHLSIRAENWRSAVATIGPFAVGAALPFAPIVVWYHQLGGLDALVYWTLLVNEVNYTLFSGGIGVARAAWKLLHFIPLWFGALAGVLATRPDRDPGELPALLALCLVLSLPVLLVRQYDHYYLQFLPFATPLAGHGLLTAAGVGTGRQPMVSRAVLIILVVSGAVLPTVAVGANAFAVANESSGLSGQRAVAADINHCVPDDERLLVLGFPQYYTLTDRYPDPPNVYYFEVNRNVTYTDASLLRRINRTSYVLLTRENYPRVHERLRETWRTAGQWTNVAHVMTLFVHPDADLPCRRTDGPSATT